MAQRGRSNIDRPCAQVRVLAKKINAFTLGEACSRRNVPSVSVEAWLLRWWDFLSENTSGGDAGFVHGGHFRSSLPDVDPSSP
jgi:hypothetical protein